MQTLHPRSPHRKSLGTAEAVGLFVPVALFYAGQVHEFETWPHLDAAALPELRASRREYLHQQLNRALDLVDLIGEIEVETVQ